MGVEVPEELSRAKEEADGEDRLAELYERHAPAAGRLAFLLTGDRSLAEDLVQEVRAHRWPFRAPSGS